MSDQSVLVLDIETRPDPHVIEAPDWRARLEARIEPDSRLKDPLKIEADRANKLEAAYRKAALRTTTSLIACIGFMNPDDENATVLTVEELTRKGERALLSTFAIEIAQLNRPVFVTWNGRDFDVPMLIARSAVHGIDVALPAPRDYRRVIDLRDFYPDGSLSEWRYVLGGGFKDVEGEDLLQLSLEALTEHCRDDVKLTAHLAHRTQSVWWRSL